MIKPADNCCVVGLAANKQTLWEQGCVRVRMVKHVNTQPKTKPHVNQFTNQET
jgi:hypothetical protein